MSNTFFQGVEKFCRGVKPPLRHPWLRACLSRVFFLTCTHLHQRKCKDVFKIPLFKPMVLNRGSMYPLGYEALKQGVRTTKFFLAYTP